MSDYIIIGDATSDISQKFVDEANAIVLPMSFTIDDKEYEHYLDCRNMSLEEFYKLETEGKVAKTSQLNEVFIINSVKPYLDKGLDVLFVSFSSGLSGTFNSIRLAFEELKDDYPDRTLLALDSLCASSGEGLLLLEAFRNKKKLMLIVELVRLTDSTKIDRLGLDEKYEQIFDTKVPKTIIYVMPGRNIAAQVEVAAMNWRLKSFGKNPGAEFIERIDKIVKGEKQ